MRLFLFSIAMIGIWFLIFILIPWLLKPRKKNEQVQPARPPRPCCSGSCSCDDDSKDDGEELGDLLDDAVDLAVAAGTVMDAPYYPVPASPDATLDPDEPETEPEPEKTSGMRAEADDPTCSDGYDPGSSYDSYDSGCDSGGCGGED